MRYQIIVLLAFGIVIGLFSDTNARVITVGRQNEDYQSIQEAIENSVDNDEIRVSHGIYEENINFIGRNIRLIGNPLNPDSVIIDGTRNGSVVTFASSETNLARLEGFTIMRGSGTLFDPDYYDGWYGGGGILCLFASPTISNCIIRNNSVPGSPSKGGGIHLRASEAIISDCVVRNNYADFHGGGIYCTENPAPQIINCTIRNNSTYYWGGGGGLFVNYSDPVITGSVITANSGGGGGGVAGHSCNPTFLFCEISNNSCQWRGLGGGFNFSHLACHVTLKNCTIWGNSTNAGGAVYLKTNSHVEIINSIIYANSSPQVYCYSGQLPNTVSVSYSDLQGGIGSISNGNGITEWLEGNIDSDPNFENPGTGNFQLTPNSPCIDAGNRSPEFDDPDGTWSDMGAYYLHQDYWMRQIHTHDTPHHALDVVVRDKLAYIADHRSGFRIIDVTDSTATEEIGFHDTPYAASNIRLKDNYAFVADGLEGVHIYDISDPEDPDSITTIEIGNYAYDVFIRDTLIFIADGWSGLLIMNISDPFNPEFVSRTEHNVWLYCECIVVGNYAYISNSGNGLLILNISNPAHPVAVREVPIAGDAAAVDVEGNYAYVPAHDGTYGVRIINISVPENAFEEGHIPLHYCVDVKVMGDIAFALDANTGIFAYDISDPENPDSLCCINDIIWNVAVFVDSPHIYLAGGYEGLLILEGSANLFQNEPDISVTPEFLDFGDVEFRRTSSPISFTVSNEGNADLTVSDISVDSDYYEIIDFDGQFILESEENRTFNVIFTPNESDELPDLITISSDDPDEPEVFVDLNGTGVWVTPQTLLARLILEVNALRDAGSINRGQENGLVVKLEHPIDRLNRGQVRPAVNQINAFINHVNDLIEEGVLTEEEGRPLAVEAQFIIDLINEFGVDGQGLQLLSDQVPTEYYFDPCYPNPFNPETTLSFGLPEVARVNINIYDCFGRLVTNLTGASFTAGHHSLIWNATNVPAGTYIIDLNAGEYENTQKVTLVR